MATHNKTEGTGGLDASLVFELDRLENTPQSIDDTFGVIGVHFGAYRSGTSNQYLVLSAIVFNVAPVSDLLALACGFTLKTHGLLLLTSTSFLCT